MQKNKIYLGYDYREDLAYEVAKSSIESRSTSAEVIKLKRQDLPQLTREITWNGNNMWCPIANAAVGTEFTFSRFLIPHLTKGWALFLDSDVIVLDDISKLFELADPNYAVMVVKHDYEPTEELHMVDQIQTKYARKNWASVILWNCDHPANKELTLEKINTWVGRDLHGFRWLKDEEIGSLPPEWNYLVDVNEPIENPKIMHYTLGGPWLNGWEEKDSDKSWNDELEIYNQSKP